MPQDMRFTPLAAAGQLPDAPLAMPTQVLEAMPLTRRLAMMFGLPFGLAQRSGPAQGH